MRRIRALVLGLFFLMLVTPNSIASAQGDSLDEAARLTFNSGREAFQRGDYETALRLFRQAHDLSPHPFLLYNIATTLDRMRRDCEALEAFRQYLRASPGAEDRREVESRIAQLESYCQQDQEPPPPPPPPDDGLHPAIFFSAAGATLAAGGLTLFFGLRTISRNDDYEEYVQSPGANLMEGQRLLDEAQSAQLLTNIMIGVTAAFAATTTVLIFFTNWDHFSESDSQPTVTPTAAFDREGGLLGLNLRF